MKLNNKFKRKLLSKEKQYNSRLEGDYKFIYRKKRDPKLSIKRNKRKAKSIKTRVSLAVISFPKKFDIYHESNKRQTLKATNGILSKGRRVKLDLYKVEVFSAAATAYLLSVIHKALSFGIVVRCSLPKSEKSRAVLQKVGLIDLLNQSSGLSSSQVSSYPDVKRWYVHKGIDWDGEELSRSINEFTNAHLDDTDIRQIPDQHRKRIERNIKELIGNILEHAYQENYKYDRHWILFGMYREEKEELVLVISDSGATIPKTYVHYHKDKPTMIERVGRKGLKTDDDLIKMAVQEKVSGTRISGRGYGLKSVEKSVSKTGGSLLIFSRKGQYMSGKQIFSVKLRNRGESVNGTVINISLPLETM